MPRRERPFQTSRSEHWMRVAVNESPAILDAHIRAAFGWPETEAIEWRSPLRDDAYAEYYDETFLERLGIADLKAALKAFWPSSGPRWDALARTASGKLILVEAKAYIEEGVDYRSKASPESLARIRHALEDAKLAYAANPDAPWQSPFYQYANRLAHLYFLADRNDLDAWLVFLCFADAPDVPEPCTKDQWEGARRLTEKCLGLGTHKLTARVGTSL